MSAADLRAALAAYETGSYGDGPLAAAAVLATR